MWTERSKARKTIIVVLLAAAIITTSGCQKKGIYATDWVLLQKENTDALNKFIGSFDTAVTLLSLGTYTYEDFYNTLDILNGQFTILKAAFLKSVKDNPIRPDTQDEITTHAYNGMIRMWDIEEERLGKIIALVENNMSEDEIEYVYMSYADELKDAVVEYLAAYETIVELAVKNGYLETETEIIEEH